MTSAPLRQGRINGIIIAIAGFIWFLLLGYRDLLEPDEGRYAEIAREMLSSGDWITPRLNGFKYFEKPPLQYWGSAISMALLGETNAAARVWCSGLGFIGALWVGFVGNRLYGRSAGFFAFLFLISTVLYVGMGHANSLDMGVSALLIIAVGALALAQSERHLPKQERNWMLLAWAALAGATLSKGLIGLVLPGGAVVLYSLWQRDWTLWRHLHLGKGLLVYLLIAAPWFVAVSWANPEFPHFFFIHEHFERFTSDVHGRTKSNWYFFAVFAIGAMPWLFSAINGLIKPPFSWRAEAGKFEASRLFWVYAIFVFFFFSISHSKLQGYILPMFPALALLVGENMSKRKHLIADGIVAIAIAVIGFIFIIWKTGSTANPDKLAQLMLLRPWIIATAFLLGAAGISALLLRNKKNLTISIFALCALLGIQMFSWGYQSISELRSSRAMAEAIQSYLKKSGKDNVAIYDVCRYDQSLPYYLGRTINIVNFRDELEFGINQEPQKWLNDADFLPIWLNADQAIGILNQKTYNELNQVNFPWNQPNFPMRIIYENSRYVAVARR
ncbi:MAG: glycosyltransferase family 39 protein [Methylobacter sp.]|uniref:glycosyltransferase family 39 protein n=1 Tax=Methylobacter sp. TaxID=2051955 RepID=UPI0025DA482D|nr:glycosyltransferase family 39 protein [Methylobacter sp.]MCK9619436.1 glycosyltransferase family 39 protein [Methylobacter sp.]